MRRYVVPLLLALSLAPTPTVAAEAGWPWPVTGPILRGFDPPDSPYGSGHRGIDIVTSPGTPVLAPADGVVAFAGQVGGRLFLTLDHGGGLESTYSWLDSVLVRRGEPVARGATVATSGWGHVDALVPHLHMGVKRDDVYLDPLSLLEPISVGAFIRLAPTWP